MGGIQGEVCIIGRMPAGKREKGGRSRGPEKAGGQEEDQETPAERAAPLQINLDEKRREDEERG
jgi:hypothetical protein